MGDLICLVKYSKWKRKSSSEFQDELDRLWIPIRIWNHYTSALERQCNVNWMENFFYPDWDW